MNLSASNTSQFKVYPLQYRSQDEVIAETLVACLLFILGVTGNSLICYVIYKKRFTSSSMYFFMLNLACADLLVCFVSIPLTLLATRPEPVHAVEFGWVGCKIIRFIQYMLPPASVAILTATAIDRYFHICIPLKRMITTSATKQLAGICWGCSIILTLPVFFLIETESVTYQGQVYQFCNIHETSRYLLAGTVYLVFRGLLGFAVPLAVISVLYCKIVRTVWRRDSNHSTNRQRANVVKSLLTVVIAFTLSWTPFSVCNKYYLYMKQTVITRQEIITFWVGLSASVYNPVIYAFFNKKFRDAFKVVVFGKKVMQRSQAVVLQGPVHRPRAKTLPVLLSTDIPQDTQAKTRHLSIGFPHLLARSELITDHQINNITTLETQSLGNQQMKLENQNSKTILIDSYACADEGDGYHEPTRKSNVKTRKIALPNLLPPVHFPIVLRRSHTFQDRNYVTGRTRLGPVNQDIRHNDVNHVHFSRYASRRTNLSKSKSFNGTGSLKSYDNPASRL